MNTIYFSPPWFFAYDISLEFLFAIISLAVSLFAFHLYKVSSKKQLKLFGISFLTISISYFIQSIFNFLIVAKLNEHICQVMRIHDAAVFDALGMYVQVIFMTIGLSLLTYMTFKTEKPRVFWLIAAAALVAIFSSKHVLYTYYLISTIFLLFLSWHFIDNYLKNKHKHTLIIALAFIFLLIRDIQFVFSIDYGSFYVLGRLAELVGYLLIAGNFYMIKKKKKKR